MAAAEKIPLLYVGSIAHSGSTLLDLMLNNHPDIQSVGEIHFIDNWLAKNLKCSCGQPIRSCMFWQDVYGRLDGGMDFRLNGLIPGRWRNHTIWWKNQDANAQAYGWRTYDLYRSILKTSGCRVIVESSKRTSRLLNLIQSGLFDITLLHLIRDGRALAYTNLIPKARPAYGGTVYTPVRGIPGTTFSWIMRNLNLEWIAQKHPQVKTMRIRYEDLALNPADTLQKIARLCDCPGLEKYDSPGTENIHNISGSRWRFKSNVKIRFDEKWRQEMSRRDQRVFNALGGWMNHRYGYTLKSTVSENRIKKNR